MSHQPFRPPERPETKIDNGVLFDDDQCPTIGAVELVDLALEVQSGCRTVGPEPLWRAAKTIELSRLKLWEAERKLAVSEAARSAEAGDRDDEEEVLDLETATVRALRIEPENFLTAIAAALPAGTRCSIHLEREHPK